jgi:hypothetical protein
MSHFPHKEEACEGLTVLGHRWKKTSTAVVLSSIKHRTVDEILRWRIQEGNRSYFLNIQEPVTYWNIWDKSSYGPRQPPRKRPQLYLPPSNQERFCSSSLCWGLFLRTALVERAQQLSLSWKLEGWKGGDTISLQVGKQSQPWRITLIKQHSVTQAV